MYTKIATSLCNHLYYLLHYISMSVIIMSNHEVPCNIEYTTLNNKLNLFCPMPTSAFRFAKLMLISSFKLYKSNIKYITIENNYYLLNPRYV